MGSEPSIFRVATVDRLVKWAMNHNHFLNEDYVRRSATIALADFYREYQDRFEFIGHPQDHMLPLNIRGVPEDDDEVNQERLPFPEVEWKPIAL